MEGPSAADDFGGSRWPSHRARVPCCAKSLGKGEAKFGGPHDAPENLRRFMRFGYVLISDLVPKIPQWRNGCKFLHQGSWHGSDMMDVATLEVKIEPSWYLQVWCATRDAFCFTSYIAIAPKALLCFFAHVNKNSHYIIHTDTFMLTCTIYSFVLFYLCSIYVLVFCRCNFWVHKYLTDRRCTYVG